MQAAVGFIAAEGRVMGAAAVWGGGLIAIVVVLMAVYVALLLRGIANERVISQAIASMIAARRVRDVPPQRSLLRAVAKTLADQERAASRIEVAVREWALSGPQSLTPKVVIEEILSLPEPQELVTDFFAEHAGDAGSAGAFAAFAGQLIRMEIMRVYPDLDDDWSADLDKLLAVAADGRISTVAFAGLDVRIGTRQRRAPRMTDADEVTVPEIARAIERATRRQLRLATLLHGQAEAILRLRDARWKEKPRGAAVRSLLHPPGQDESGGESPDPGGASRWLRMRRLLAAPRIKLRRPGFRKEDLESLEVTFDAIGEAVENAVECLGNGEPMRALYLLTGISVPVPAGLPGRIYNRDSLAQVRPLVAIGVWHRLAVCRWAATAMREVGDDVRAW
jgi:hypothetical protein